MNLNDEIIFISKTCETCANIVACQQQYSRNPQDGHPDKTDTSIKRTPNLGPSRFFSHLLYFNPLSQEGGGGIVATPPFGFSLVPFLQLLRLPYGQFTHPLPRYPCINDEKKISKLFAVKNVGGWGRGCNNPPRPEREGVAEKINTFS